MTFPTSPQTGQLYTDSYGTVWEYLFDKWYRNKVTAGNDTNYTAGASGGPVDITTASGYIFQNSSFFSSGTGHTGNTDVIIDVEEGTPTQIIWSDTTAGESGVSDTTVSYDISTGLISLTGVTADQFILVRCSIDIEPDSDESNAKLILECTANGDSGAFTFGIEEQFLSMDQGAQLDYEGLSSVPIFIGSTLADSGGTATIKPCIELKNTTGDIKPRTIAVYVWS